MTKPNERGQIRKHARLVSRGTSCAPEDLNASQSSDGCGHVSIPFPDGKHSDGSATNMAML